MGELDRPHRVKLVVDEWGAWHGMTTNLEPGHLFGQQSTVRDALVAGLTLDTFNRHADKVAMANIAQLVNCIQSLFLADEDRFLVTPTYHVFAMHAPHQGATSLRTEFSAPGAAWTDGQGNAQSLQTLDGSASLRDRTLTLTVTNRHIAKAQSADIAIRGASVRSARTTTLRSDDVHDHNTFERPDTVRPVTAEPSLTGTELVYDFPAASVTRLDLELA
jgi:alpha-N-arabinofuranosidase